MNPCWMCQHSRFGASVAREITLQRPLATSNVASGISGQVRGAVAVRQTGTEQLRIIPVVHCASLASLLERRQVSSTKTRRRVPTETSCSSPTSLRDRQLPSVFVSQMSREKRCAFTPRRDGQSARQRQCNPETRRQNPANLQPLCGVSPPPMSTTKQRRCPAVERYTFPASRKTPAFSFPVARKP